MFEWIHSLNGPSTIFFYGFVIGAVLTLLYVLLSDIFGAVFDGVPGGFLNPTVILSFITILCCSGFFLEFKTSWSTGMITGVSAVIAFLIVTFLHIFVMAPMSKAEQNTATSLKDLVGYIGKVTISIPEDGMGEVVVNKHHQINNYGAISSDNTAIPSETEVRIISVEKDNVLLVEPYHRSLKN